MELDCSNGDSGAGEKPGYVVIDASGFGTPGPCLQKAYKEETGSWVPVGDDEPADTLQETSGRVELLVSRNVKKCMTACLSQPSIFNNNEVYRT